MLFKKLAFGTQAAAGGHLGKMSEVLAREEQTRMVRKEKALEAGGV